MRKVVYVEVSNCCRVAASAADCEESLLNCCQSEGGEKAACGGGDRRLLPALGAPHRLPRKDPSVTPTPPTTSQHSLSTPATHTCSCPRTPSPQCPRHELLHSLWGLASSKAQLATDSLPALLVKLGLDHITLYTILRKRGCPLAPNMNDARRVSTGIFFFLALGRDVMCPVILTSPCSTTL